MTDVVMPQMGESIVEGTLTKWLKKAGDTVERDEPLFEISTDKVDTEIPAPAAGVLAEVLVQEGQTVGVNAIVGRINEGGEAAAAPAATPAKAEPLKPAAPAQVSGGGTRGARSAAAPVPARQSPTQRNRWPAFASGAQDGAREQYGSIRQGYGHGSRRTHHEGRCRGVPENGIGASAPALRLSRRLLPKRRQRRPRPRPSPRFPSPSRLPKRASSP